MSDKWGRGGIHAHKTQPQPLLGLCGERTRHLTPALAFFLKWQDDTRFSHNDWPHFCRRISMFLEVNWGRKKKQDKGQASKLPLCPVTTARSAGSCGVLKGRCSAYEIVALTLFSVEFGCLLRAAKSCWGVPGLLRHESPFKKCVAENKIGFKPGSQVVTFLKISARSPGYYWEVVICFAADKEAARCTTT